MNNRELYPKSKFKLCLTKLRKVEVQESEDNIENENKHYKVVNSEWQNGNGKEFRLSIQEDRKNGINRTIEVVNEKPENFVINQIYMLSTRDRVWIWTEEE